VIGALGAIPVYCIAREIASTGVAVGAGALYAFLPVSVTYARVGNPDHHVSVAAVGACLLLLCVKLAAPGQTRSALMRFTGGLMLGRVVMLLTWHGSLLYLALLEASLLGIALLAGRREVQAVQALSALGTLLLVAPLLATFPTPLMGLYSSIALSRLHLIAVAGAGTVAAVGWWYEARAVRPTRLAARVTVTGVAALLFVAGVFSLPGPRDGIEPALRFLTMTDAAGAKTVEQFALFSIFGRSDPDTALNTWGLYAYGIPLAPVSLILWAMRRRSPSALVVAAWAGFFGALALSQLRYGNEAAASVCVGFAVGGAQLRALFHRRLGLGSAPSLAAVLLLGVALYLPPIRNLYLPWAGRAWVELSASPGEAVPPLATPGWALHQFLVGVRAVTPETSGYVAQGVEPEYGVVAQASLGHALQWVARRATPTDPFWEYIGPANWKKAFALLDARDEGSAVGLAGALRARYVVASAGAAQGSLLDRLYQDDGLRSDPLPALQRFRLVTETSSIGGALEARPARGAGLGHVVPRTPYKLFEVVPGAQLEVSAPPASAVEVSVPVQTPTGRAFVYRLATRTPETGVATFRVPYANTPNGRSIGPFGVRVGPRWQVTIDGRPAGASFVPESAVLRGERVAFQSNANE
jgi:asparagine N-glycosylation enzyme membrane subunit Stt3